MSKIDILEISSRASQVIGEDVALQTTIHGDLVRFNFSWGESERASYLISVTELDLLYANINDVVIGWFEREVWQSLHS